MPEIITIFPGLAEKQYFQHPETSEFWFHATSACKSLGFDNPSRALMMYTDEDERFKEVYEGRETWFVSESGFYGLAFASKKPEAKAFKRWLKHDVLPKLRSQGLYVTTVDGESLVEYKWRETVLIQTNQQLIERAENWKSAVFRGKSAKQLFDFFNVSCGYCFPPTGYRDFQKLVKERYGIYFGDSKSSTLFRYTKETLELSVWFPRAMVELVEQYRLSDSGYYGDSAEFCIHKVRNFFGVKS